MNMPFRSVRTAAATLGLTTGRVRQLLIAGTIRGQKLGRAWLIHRDELTRYRADLATKKEKLSNSA